MIKRISSSLHDREGSIFRFSPTRTRNFNQTIESAFDDMWTLFKVPSLPSVKSVSQGSADVLETEMRIHMGAGGHGKPQPPDLNMRLSPVDLSSIPAAKRSRVVVPNQ